MRLSVPPIVYSKLKKRFAALSIAEDRIFLAKYRCMYGENAYRYLMKTYRSVNVSGQYLLQATPSGQTLKRILQLVPTVMSTDERFELFQEIIDYNEQNDDRRNYHYRTSGDDDLSKSLSFSYEDWICFGEGQIKSRIEKIGRLAIRSIDYKSKYDFSDVKWLLDNDITAFCQLIERARKLKIETRITAAVMEINSLKSKWRDLAEGSVSSTRHSEMQYNFTLAGQNVSVTIFDAKERARKAKKEKLNNFLGNVGCLTVIVIIILLSFLGKK